MVCLLDVPATFSLAQQLSQLRELAAACRTQAIRLNAKLSLIEREYLFELRAIREHLARSSARLDHAIDDLERIARRGVL